MRDIEILLWWAALLLGDVQVARCEREWLRLRLDHDDFVFEDHQRLREMLPPALRQMFVEQFDRRAS